MEKLSSSPLKDFVNSIRGFKFNKKKSEDTMTSDLHTATTATKILVNLAKVAGYLTETINPLKLRDLLFKEFQSDWIEWLPEVLEKELLDGKHNKVIMDKTQALALALSSDSPWKEWHIFENVGTAFNHREPDFSVMQPLSLGECETTLRTLEGLRMETLSEEVLHYIAITAFTNNIVYLPKEWLVSIASDKLDNLVFDFELKNKTYWAWEQIKNKELSNHSFGEDSLSRQIATLSTINQFVKEF